MIARTAEKAPGPPVAAGQGPRRGPQSLARRFEDAGKGVGADAGGCVSVTGRGGGTGEVCRFWQWPGKNDTRASPSGKEGCPHARGSRTEREPGGRVLEIPCDPWNGRGLMTVIWEFPFLIVDEFLWDAVDGRERRFPSAFRLPKGGRTPEGDGRTGWKGGRVLAVSGGRNSLIIFFQTSLKFAPRHARGVFLPVIFPSRFFVLFVCVGHFVTDHSPPLRAGLSHDMLKKCNRDIVIYRCLYLVVVQCLDIC